MDGIAEWAKNLVWDELVVLAFRYLVVSGVALMIGTLLFGRRYKSRIRGLEEQVARLQKRPQYEIDKVSVLHTPGREGMWQETQFTLKQGLTYRLQFEDQGREKVLEPLGWTRCRARPSLSPQRPLDPGAVDEVSGLPPPGG